MNRRTKIIVSVAGIFIVLLALLGLTYAYFLTRINGNTNDKSISVSTAKLELTYSDNSSEILGSGKVLMPSNEPIGTKTFTVTNKGGDTNYSVVLENMSIKNVSDNTETEFYSNDFVYTLTCTVKGNTPCGNQAMDETAFPLSDGALINNDIAASDVHTYTLTLWYKETGIDQSRDMGKSLNAKINIIDPLKENPYRNNKKLLAYHIINNSINRINGTNLVSSPKTIPAKESTTFEYAKPEDPINFNSSEHWAYENYITYASDYTVDKYTGTYTLGTNENPITIKKYIDVKPEEIAGKYAIFTYIDENSEEESLKYAKEVTNLNNIYKITSEIEDITHDIVKYGLFSTNMVPMISTEHELSMALDDYGTSYYYRGGVTNNYIEFNNMCFRIVRIQGDGSIKLILTKEDLCSTISETDTKSALINDAQGVQFGSNEDGSYNYEGYTGGLFTTLNNWYNNNFASVQEKLKNETWCLEERMTGNIPTQVSSLSLRCSSSGKRVSGYVGALIADEAAYAGTVSNFTYNNSTYYLWENSMSNFWTISPSGQYVYCVNTRIGSYLGANGITGKYAVRPVIVLASGTEIDSGDGTKNNPYRIK